MANQVEIILKGTDLTGPAFTSSIRRMRDVGRAAADMFGVFATGAAIGAVGSLAALTARSIQAADEMGKLAQKAGLPVEQFSQLAFAAKQADVSSEALTKGFKALGEEMVRQGRGGESLLQQILAQADVFAKMEDGAEKTTRAVQLFGKTGQDLIPLLNEGSAAIRRQMEEADKLGQTISSDFAKNADEFGDNLNKIKASFTGLGNEVAKVVLPALTSFTNSIAEWIKEGPTLIGTADAIGQKWKWYKGLIDDLTVSMLQLNAISETWIFGGKGAVGDIGKKVRSGLATERTGGITPTDLPGVRVIGLDGSGEMQGPPIPPAGSTSAINPGAVAADRIKTIEAWGAVHANTLAKALQIEQEFELEKLNGSQRERARIDADFQNKIAKIQELALTEEVALEMSLRAQEAYHEQLRRFQLQTFANNVDTAARGFGALANLAGAFGRKQFKLMQGLRIGEAIMHGAAGIIRVWADPGYPAAIALTAIIAAETAAQVATIGAQKPPAAHGGLDFVPAETTYLLDRGERVLSPRQNKDFTEAIESGGMGGPIRVIVNLNGQPILDEVSRASRDGRIEIHARAVR
jgi:hypothetical protein